MTRIVFIGNNASLAKEIASAQIAPHTTAMLIVADGLGRRTIGDLDVIDVGETRWSPWRTRLESSVVGRTLLRASPLDSGVQFWRLVRRSGDARECLSAADVVVSTTRNAILTAWKITRRQPKTIGLNGLGAGLAAMTDQ